VDLLIRSYETFAKYLPNSMLNRMLEDSEVLYDRHKVEMQPSGR